MIDTVDDMIEQAARHLAIDVDAGCTQGYERILAGEVYERIPEDKRPLVLRWLIEGLVSDITTGSVNLLDECADATYKTADEITDKLADAVRQQDHVDRTLFHLLAREITEREHLNRVLRKRAA